MANFPTSLDTLSNPTGSDLTENSNPLLDHDYQHSTANDILEALEAKVGVNSSAVTTSFDYKLGEVTSTDKAVGKSATQTLTNKTIDASNNTLTGVVSANSTDTLTNKTLTAPKFADSGFIADSNGNEQIKFTTTASAVNEISITNAATGNAPLISASGGDSSVSLTIAPKGLNANLNLSVADGISLKLLANGGETVDRYIGIYGGRDGYYSPTIGVDGTGTNIDLNLDAKGTGTVLSSDGLVSKSSTKGIGYSTGAGGAVTQATSRTTGVTLNKVCGAITLVSAAGSTTPASFTVTNSTVVATDTIILSQKSGTDKYSLDVTAVGSGSFEITFNTKSGTTTEQPVFNFSVIKSVTS